MTDSAPPAPPRAERFLLFSLGSGRFAVEGRVVRGVVPVESFTPIPRAPACVRGVFQHRGVVMPLLDASKALELAVAPGRTPVLTLLLEAASWSVGMAIDEVKAYEKLSVGETAAGDGARAGAFTKGVLDQGGERFAVLDAEALLQALRAA